MNRRAGTRRSQHGFGVRRRANWDEWTDFEPHMFFFPLPPNLIAKIRMHLRRLQTGRREQETPERNLITSARNFFSARKITLELIIGLHDIQDRTLEFVLFVFLGAQQKPPRISKTIHMERIRAKQLNWWWLTHSFDDLFSLSSLFMYLLMMINISEWRRVLFR